MNSDFELDVRRALQEHLLLFFCMRWSGHILSGAFLLAAAAVMMMASDSLVSHHNTEFGSSRSFGNFHYSTSRRSNF